MPRPFSLPVTFAPLFCSALALAQSTLTTTFVSDNGGSVGGAVHFDLTVLNPAGVVLSRLDVNVTNPTNTNAAIELWMTNLGGSHVGSQVNPPPGTWSLRGTANVVTAGTNNPTIAVLNNPVPLAPGTYGVTLVHVGCSARYTGTAAAPPTQTTFANGDLRIDAGTAQNIPFSSGVFTPRIANVTLHYALQTVDVCSFSADVVRGPSPLIVNFTDRSVTPSGAITNWDWDFDGDGITDSTQQNPLWIFPFCGNYTVRLRVTTASGSSQTTWSDHVQTDPLIARFTASAELGPPPLTVNFTDTSTLTPLTWSWDFDGDGVADSTLQNPTGIVFGPGSHAVTLTVTNGCRIERMTKRITAATNMFATGGAPNSFVNTTSVVFFDLTVTATEALSICGIDFRSYTPAGNPMLVDVYLTDTTYTTKLTTPAAWRKVATATGTTPEIGTAARLVLDRPILLLPNRTYGVGFHHIGNASYYVNLTAPISNADLTLTPGAVAFSPNGPFTNPSPFQIRQWVGELHYLRRSSFPQAGITFFGPGCPSTPGVVSAMAPQGSERPLVGTTTNVSVTNLPLSAAIVLIGLSNTGSPFGPLPLDLTPFGAPGCTAHVSPDASTFVLGAGGSAGFALTLPANPALAGAAFYLQSLVLAPGVNGLGAVLSDAVAGLVGIF